MSKTALAPQKCSAAVGMLDVRVAMLEKTLRQVAGRAILEDRALVADVEAILGPKALLAAAGAEKVKERHVKEVQEQP